MRSLEKSPAVDRKSRSRSRAAASPPPATIDDDDEVVLQKISSVAHVQVAVNDLVAFEYVAEDTHEWHWGLGTVASIPGPRLVQLMLWVGQHMQATPEVRPAIESSHTAADLKRLAELQQRREAAEKDMEDVNKVLAARQAHYSEGRTAFEADAARAREAALEARVEVENLREADWREIRSYVNPPDIVKLITEAMMLTIGERALDWNYVLKVIRQRSFQKRLAQFDPQGMTPAVRRRIRQEYLANPRFTHKDSLMGSCALGVVQRWVVAQLETSETAVDIMDYDQAHAREKAQIEKMESTLRDRRRDVEQIKAEESLLRRKLGDQPVLLDYKENGNGPTKGETSQRSRPTSGKTGPKKDRTPRSEGTRSSAGERTARGRAGAPPLTENVYGSVMTWRFSEESKMVLHSSILVNFQTPLSTVVTLRPEQVEGLRQALAVRASPFAAQLQADDRIKDLEDDVEELRGALADALQDLTVAKAKQAEHDAEIAAKDREIEEAKGMSSPVPSSDTPVGEQKEELLASFKSLATSAAEDGQDPPSAHRTHPLKRHKVPLSSEKGSKRVDPTAMMAKREQAVAVAASNGSSPGLSRSADDRGRAAVKLELLEQQIRILRQASTAADDVLDSVRDAINRQPQLKQYIDERA